MHKYEKSLIDLFTSKIDKVNKSTVMFEGTSVHKSNLYKKIEIFDLMQAGYPQEAYDSQAKMDQIRRDIVSSCLKEWANDKVMKSDLGNQFSELDPRDFTLLEDIVTGNRIVYSNKAKTVTDFHPTAFSNLCKIHQVTPELIHCKVEYNPYARHAIYNKEFSGINITAVNTYIPPSWMRAKNDTDYIHTLTPQEIDDLVCPPIIMEFLKELIPDTWSLEFTLAWMHNALTSRCQTYLLLNGAKGIGKNIFAENLMAALVDKENHKVSPVSLLQSQFNATLENCRVLVADEIQAKHPSQVDKLKRYLNDVQNIEKKGIDAIRNTKVYFSAILLNNRIDDIYLTQDDRRYSVPILTKDRLDFTWGEKKVDDLIAALKDPENIEKFGYWVLHKCGRESVTPNTALKSRHFYNMCYASLSQWKKVMIDCCLESEQDEVSLTHVRKQFQNLAGYKFNVSSSTIENFFNEYLIEGIYKIGELRHDYVSSKRVIKLSEEFIEYRDKRVNVISSKQNETNDEIITFKDLL